MKLWAVWCVLWAMNAGRLHVQSATPNAHSRVPASSGRLKAVSINRFAFAPAELTVEPGDTVVWTNDDPFLHTTAADSEAWSSPELARGQRFVLALTRPGRYPYHCAAHPVMRGLLVVKQ